MKLLILGATGLVGSRFVELYPSKDKLLTPTASELDITSSKSISDFFKNNNPDIVVNFVAFTNVGEAENERGDKNGQVWRINVEGAKNIASAVRKSGAFFIQISTDYVFPATKDNPGPYEESHMPETDSKKLTWYGYTKAEAERQIESILIGKYALVRIIYPFRAEFDKKLDYIRKPLSLYEQGNLYPMFNDQQVSITYIDDLYIALNKIIEGKMSGIFHVSSFDTTTPFEIMNYVIEKKKGIKNTVKPSSLIDFLKKADNPVRYPQYGGLKTKKTERKLGMKFKTWREMIDDLVASV